MHTTTALDLVRLDPVETAVGMPLGSGAARAEVPVNGSARQVLEDLVARALAAGPSVVTFSGGRDSSAVLAVGAHVARERGLPLPVPLTLVYPGIDEADEADWQSLVLDHLGITEREVVVVDHEERLLGERARASLHRHGVVWPAALHADPVLSAVAPGSQVLTGEGGDEVVGPRRITPWAVARADGWRPQSRGHARSMLRSMTGPTLPLGPLASHDPTLWAPDWLRGGARTAYRDHVARTARTPWSYEASTTALTARRVPQVLAHNVGAFGAARGLTFHHPLQDPGFVRALARDGGRWGFRGRTDTMRFLFGDLLPDPLLARRSKASFNGTRFGDDERDFALTWDGTGVDPRLVDTDALRRHWLSERPAGVTGPLLHLAWLSSQGFGENGTAEDGASQ